MNTIPNNNNFCINQNWIQQANLIPPLRPKQTNTVQPIFISFANNQCISNIYNSFNQNQKLNNNLSSLLNNNYNDNNIQQSSTLNQLNNNLQNSIPKKVNDNKKLLLKEKNRIAAKRWRKKKDIYLEHLDSENFVLRTQVLSMLNKFQELKCETSFLNDELQFFQSFMSENMKINKS